MNTNPYGDKSTTARFVVPFISSHAKNLKTEHNPEFKMHTQSKNVEIPMEFEDFMGGTPPIESGCAK